jgi:succinate dehydrogenase/fumarate reductase flavoprotein subunit
MSSLDAYPKEVETPEFLKKPAAITDATDAGTYDVVVIGAGSPGVPAALRAAELGAKVAILQKEPEAAACGNFGAGIDLSTSDAADVESLVSLLETVSAHRPKRELLEVWAQRSGEALEWIIERSKEAGAQVVDLGTAAHTALLNKHGWKIGFHTCVFGPKPYDTGQAMKALCTLAEKRGVDIFYATPAESLVQKDDGAIVGVIAKGKEGYLKFGAKRAVIVATGDYANDKRMMDYYLPDVTNLALKRTGRSGDGHKMIVWAGGRIENVGHTKMCHDMDSGPTSLMSAPYLRVKLDGKRFCDETVGMELMNCYLTSKKDSGHYCQVFDSTYMEQAAAWGLHVDDPDSLKNWMPEEDVKRSGVIESLIDTYKADTLEELAKKLRIEDVPAFLETVKNYNKAAETGKDTQFGVPAKSLAPVIKPPYYGVHRHIRFTVGCSGVVVNDKLQCLDQNDKPIKGLYAIGNLAGNFYGGADYPLDVLGLNLGHNYTEGYVVAEEVSS